MCAKQLNRILFGVLVNVSSSPFFAPSSLPKQIRCVTLVLCSLSLEQTLLFIGKEEPRSGGKTFASLYFKYLDEAKMASKRKSEPVKKTAKRGKKKTDDSFDSDLSDDYGDEVSGNGNGNSATQPITFDERAVLPKLPEELLASRDREPGKLVVAGMITWDIGE